MHADLDIVCLLGQRCLEITGTVTDPWDRGARGEYLDTDANCLATIKCNCDGRDTSKPSQERLSSSRGTELVKLHELYIVLTPSRKYPGSYERRGLLQLAHPVAAIKPQHHQETRKLRRNVEFGQKCSREAFRTYLLDLEPHWLNESDGSKFSKLDCIFDKAILELLNLV